MRRNPTEHGKDRDRMREVLDAEEQALDGQQISYGVMPPGLDDAKAIGSLLEALRSGTAIPSAIKAATKAFGSAKAVYQALSEYAKTLNTRTPAEILSAIGRAMLGAAKAGEEEAQTAKAAHGKGIRELGIKTRQAKLDTPSRAAARSEAEAVAADRLARNAARKAAAEARGSKLGRPPLSADEREAAATRKRLYNAEQMQRRRLVSSVQAAEAMPEPPGGAPRQGAGAKTYTRPETRYIDQNGNVGGTPGAIVKPGQRLAAGMSEAADATTPRTWKPKPNEIDPEALDDAAAELHRQQMLAKQAVQRAARQMKDRLSAGGIKPKK